MIEKKDLQIVERYYFLGEPRYRIIIRGTNIVFNVRADSDEEAYEKALEMIRRIALTKDIIDKIRMNVK